MANLAAYLKAKAAGGRKTRSDCACVYMRVHVCGPRSPNRLLEWPCLETGLSSLEPHA